MSNLKNVRITSDGLEIIGASDALIMNRELYPTYDDLLKRHNEHFKVKEKIRSLGL